MAGPWAGNHTPLGLGFLVSKTGSRVPKSQGAVRTKWEWWTPQATPDAQQSLKSRWDVTTTLLSCLEGLEVLPSLG